MHRAKHSAMSARGMGYWTEYQKRPIDVNPSDQSHDLNNIHYEILLQQIELYEISE